MKNSRSKYRIVEHENGKLSRGFLEDNGDPILFGTNCTTYFPDSKIVYEETDKVRFKNLIKDKEVGDYDDQGEDI